MSSKLIIIKLCQITNWNAIRTGVLISLSFPFPTVYRKAWYDLLIKKKFLQLAFLLQHTFSASTSGRLAASHKDNFLPTALLAQTTIYMSKCYFNLPSNSTGIKIKAMRAY